jgi:MscS family membrane protein
MNVTAATSSVRLAARWLGCLGLIAILLCAAHAAVADGSHPLRPLDASSPRAVLQSFIETTDDVYRRLTKMLESYDKSGALFPNSEERRERQAALAEAAELTQLFDVSHIAPVLRDTLVGERIVQLREILDRIDLPAMADIPDQAAMARLSAKQWRLPDTEIDFVRIENGPRTGDYQLSAETVNRLPEFYRRVKDLPYRPGRGEQLVAAYRAMSVGGLTTVYDAYMNSPVGLDYIIPPRWLLNLPDWARGRAAGVATWQWLGLGLGLAIGGLIIYGGFRATGRRADDPEMRGPRWRALAAPLSIIVVAGVLVPSVATLLRIGGVPRVVIDYVQTTTVFFAAAWLAIVVSAIVGEVIVASERLTTRSLDSQLIRLGTRLVGLLAAVAILIQGGDELGLPAYSVLAGLGVGGIAVALAAQSTIANLIGSLLITLEQPFRVGHVVRIGSSEGTVEDVGFRSTRIRTVDNSMLTIPSSAVVNTTVENLSVRKKRRQRFLVQVTYDTSRAKVEDLIARIKQLIADQTLAEAETCHVRLNNFGESSLDILVIFHLLVEDYATELREREAVLLRIMDLAREMGVELAFPTRTINVVQPADSAAVRPSAEAPVIGLVSRT